MNKLVTRVMYFETLKWSAIWCNKNANYKKKIATNRSPVEIMSGKCPKCGKGFGFIARVQKWVSTEIHPEWKGKKLHPECVKQAIREWEENRKKMTLCENCHYYRSYSNSEVIDTGLFMPNPKMITFTSVYCAKFGFSLKDGKEAEKCTSYMTEEVYKEKALSGEINPLTDSNFKICKYCQTTFDLNKTHKCPKCGAP